LFILRYKDCYAMSRLANRPKHFCHVGSGASNDMVVVNQPGYALFSMQVKNGQLVQKRSSLSL